MLKNYIKLTIRNLAASKGFSVINLTGLAIGMACCIILLLYIQYELSYDRYHHNKDEIFRLCVEGETRGVGFRWGDSNAPSGPALRDEYPEVLAAVRFRGFPTSTVRFQDKLFIEDDIAYADEEVFKVFSWPVLNGDPQQALKEPYTMVLSTDMAQKYFGDGDPIGKILNFNNEENYKITGVMQNIPANSTFDFTALCSFQTLYAKEKRISISLRGWLDFNFDTYILLRKDSDFRQTEKNLSALFEKNAGKLMKIMGSQIKVFLQPLRDIHLHTPGDDAILYVYVFSAVALFILIIACLNFMNLSTARSSKRAKEVGIRKVLGAERLQVIRQFLGESFVFCFLSLGIAVFITELTLPLIRNLSGRPLSLDFTQIPWLIPGILGLALITGLMAGSYPAFFLSAFRPTAVMKGMLKRGASNVRFRRILVTSQFVISIALIIGTGLIMNQLNYLQNKDLGFNKDNLVVIPLMDNSISIQNSLEVFKQKLLLYPTVNSVAASSNIPGSFAFLNNKLPEGFNMNESQLMTDICVDRDFIPVMQIEILEGRNFSPDFPADEKESVIINQTAAASYGWEKPIGKIIRTSSSTGRGYVAKKVIGVVKDFHLEPLSQAIRPLFMANETAHRYIPLRYLLIKIHPGNQSGTIGFIQDQWKEVFPQAAFDYSFLNENFSEQFNDMQRSQKVFIYFSYLAVFIACLGLFGMASYTSEQRAKEIGIRKILGSSSVKIAVLLGKELLTNVLLANVIAWPLAYLVLNQWLRNFPYRTDVNPLLFLSAAFIVVCISVITISYQSIKAAVANPVDSLRYE